MSTVSAEAYDRFKRPTLDELLGELAGIMGPEIVRSWNRQSAIVAVLSGAPVPPRPSYRERLLDRERATYTARRARWLRAKREAA